MELRFVSKSHDKITEAQKILADTGIRIIPYEEEIQEMQTTDLEKLVKDKVLKAFLKLGRPLIVEHTALYIEELKEFPGGLTQLFWDSVGAQKLLYMMTAIGATKLTAKSLIGYCDGKKVHVFEAEIQGTVSPKPRGTIGFGWDQIFIPEGYTQTFAEIGTKNHEISMRKQAFDQLAAFMKEGTT